MDWEWICLVGNLKAKVMLVSSISALDRLIKNLPPPQRPLLFSVRKAPCLIHRCSMVMTTWTYLLHSWWRLGDYLTVPVSVTLASHPLQGTLFRAGAGPYILLYFSFVFNFSFIFWDYEVIASAFPSLSSLQSPPYTPSYFLLHPWLPFSLLCAYMCSHIYF